MPGLGIRYDEDERWSTPNPTGREGVFEAYCPPHYADIAAAVEAFAERKFGPGGPFHPDTAGAWSDSPGVRGSAQAHHLDLDFYDRFFKPGAYLPPHGQHMRRWHGG